MMCTCVRRRFSCSCISEIITDESETCDGNAKNTRGTCRMDIVRSEIAYLGYFGSEAYGLTWKVSGDKHIHSFESDTNAAKN